MPTFTIAEARNRGYEVRPTYFGAKKSASLVLAESIASQNAAKEYDIFLSHASMDAEIILGVKAILESYNYSVYVDWIDDQQLDRNQVTPATAETLRARMNMCRSLFYATTDNHSRSKWMPWECGYFDGRKNRTAILPVTSTGTESYQGQEYLGLYPYVIHGVNIFEHEMLWVHRSPTIYTSYTNWLNGVEPTEH